MASAGGSAFGDFAVATGTNSVAVGLGATATGATTTAVGTGATAAPDNSAAFGAGATATRANQQVFGTATNTYTAPGITSDASKAAQGAPTHIVTTNPTGDLAAHTPAELGLAGNIIDISLNPTITSINQQITNINKQITILQQNDRQLTEGIAVAMALHDPDLVAGEKFGLKLNWGAYEGGNALALTAAGVLGYNVLTPGDRLAVSGGMGWGLDQSQIGGRVGVQLTWK